MPELTRFYHARLLRDHKIEEGDLWVSDGKIVPPGKADKEVDLQGQILAPGFIDLQLNGAFGKDFSSDVEIVDEVAKELPRYGVTSFLPTLVSCSGEQYREIIPTLMPQKRSQSAEVLGVHLEGPFISSGRRGMHPQKHICPIEQGAEKALEMAYGDLDGVKMVTLAPEIPGSAAVTKVLAKQGIVVAAGHTAATRVQLRECMGTGLTMVTHLFNGMRAFHHRHPGVVGTALSNDNLFFSVIADGVHVDDEVLALLWRIRQGGMVLVSDGMAAMGLESGLYQLGDVDVVVEGDVAHVAGTEVIAGSIASMDSAVRRLYKATGCSQAEALEAASLMPAKVLGIEHKKGTLNEGADADFVLLDDKLQVQGCYIAGSATS